MNFWSRVKRTEILSATRTVDSAKSDWLPASQFCRQLIPFHQHTSPTRFTNNDVVVCTHSRRFNFLRSTSDFIAVIFVDYQAERMNTGKQ